MPPSSARPCASRTLATLALAAIDEARAEERARCVGELMQLVKDGPWNEDPRDMLRYAALKLEAL